MDSWPIKMGPTGCPLNTTARCVTTRKGAILIYFAAEVRNHAQYRVVYDCSITVLHFQSNKNRVTVLLSVRNQSPKDVPSHPRRREPLQHRCDSPQTATLWAVGVHTSCWGQGPVLGSCEHAPIKTKYSPWDEKLTASQGNSGSRNWIRQNSAISV